MSRLTAKWTYLLPAFKAWSPFNESEESGTDMLGCVDAEEAAAAYCDRNASNGNEVSPRERIHVRDEAGEVRAFDVEPEYSVSFYASEVEIKDAQDSNAPR
jgi:hypothetical protein